MKNRILTRSAEESLIEDFLLKPSGGLSILGIHGPGGVGKSMLLDHVLTRMKGELSSVLKLDVSGTVEASSEDGPDFMKLIDDHLAPRSLTGAGDPKPAKDYFPQTRKICARYAEFRAEVMEEVLQRDLARPVADTIRHALKLGITLYKLHPSATALARVDVSALDSKEFADALEGTVRSLQSLKLSSRIPGPIRDKLGLTMAEKVKTQLHAATADALSSDLHAMLARYRRSDVLKITQSKLQGVESLLLIFDDYEVLSPVLSAFLVDHFIPALAGAAFQTKMIIIGRGDLESTDVAFGQHARPHLEGEIEVRAFTRDQTIQLLEMAGIDAERHELIYEATRGFPFLVGLVIEEEGEVDTHSVGFLTKFFNRTTRWMLPSQKEWFKKVVYLDEINDVTLGAFFEGAELARVQSWFESEHSIRNPASHTFSVHALIREKVLRYLEVRSPRQHLEDLRMARAAMKELAALREQSESPDAH